MKIPIFKLLFFEDPYLNGITCIDPFGEKNNVSTKLLCKNNALYSCLFSAKKVYFRNINTFKIEHSLQTSLVVISRYKWGSRTHHRSTYHTEKHIHRIPAQLVSKTRNFSHHKFYYDFVMILLLFITKIIING